MLWGLSPALDFQSEFQSQNSNNGINILSIGSADPRHILKTIAKSYKYEEKILNFYIIEPFLEQVGRQILLLSIAFEQPEQLGLFEKTHTFMELYGNTLIRPTVSEYLHHKSHQLLNCITDSAMCKKLLPFFNFEYLKYKERDYLENLFKFWHHSNSMFNIEDQWEKRLRQSLGIRYDARKGIFDWDYYMHLKDLHKHISAHEYIEWRSSGAAFRWLETEGSKPNLTFAAGIIPLNETFINHGYVGDILTGPFISYGIECENNKVFNAQNTISNTKITEHNLMQTFNEILMKKTPMPAIPSLDEHMKKVEEKTSNCNNEIIGQNFVTKTAPIIDISNATITYLSFSQISTLHLKDDFKHFFDIIYISHDLYQKINLNITELLRDNAITIIETKKFVINSKKDETESIQNIFKKHNLYIETYNPIQDSFAKLKVKKN